MDCCSKYQGYGKHIRQGFELFLEQLHVAQGGVNVSGEMHRIELVLVDDVSDKGRTRANVRYLVRDLGIKLLLGPYSSGLTNDVAALAHATNATLMAPGASSSSVYKERPRVFGMNTKVTIAFDAAFKAVSGKVSTVAYVLEAGSVSKRKKCGSVQILANRHGMSFVQ